MFSSIEQAYLRLMIEAICLVMLSGTLNSYQTFYYRGMGLMKHLSVALAMPVFALGFMYCGYRVAMILGIMRFPLSNRWQDLCTQYSEWLVIPLVFNVVQLARAGLILFPVKCVEGAFLVPRTFWRTSQDITMTRQRRAEEPCMSVRKDPRENYVVDRFVMRSHVITIVLVFVFIVAALGGLNYAVHGMPTQSWDLMYSVCPLIAGWFLALVLHRSWELMYKKYELQEYA